MIKRVDIKKLLAFILIVSLIILLIFMLNTNGENIALHNRDAYKKSAVELVSRMSLEEKIYQMCMVTPEQITGVDTVVAAGETTKEALQEHPVGGLLYSRKNIVNRDQIRQVIILSQSNSKTALFIAIEEEGDMSGLKPMYSYRKKGRKKAETNASHIAEYIRAMGFNMDLAPVADVWSDKRNTTVSKHAYSNDFRSDAELVAAAVKGFGRKGVLCTLKHFPGAGDLTEDLSTGKTYITKTYKEMKEGELKPFISGINAGADVVMTGHMTVEEIDNKAPACFSEKVVSGLLREKMGYEGLIITDSLSDEVISDSYTAGEAAVLAVKAGNDIILEPYSVTEAVSAITEAVNTGSITESQINDSVERIIAAKLRAGIIH